MPIENSVDVEIEGIVVLGFEKNEAGDVVACFAGAITDVPDHELQIHARKLVNDTFEDFIFDSKTTELVLEAEGTGQQGIRLRHLGAHIDRISGTGPQDSIEWLLDFSGKDMHDHSIPINPKGLRSKLRIANGEVFTKKVSVNHLLARNAARPEDPLTLVGRVATKVGLAIDLDSEGSVARLIGKDQTITVQKGERLLVRFNQICPTDDPKKIGQRRAHANHYYNALEVAQEEQKEFSSTRFAKPPQPTAVPPTSPEASCYVGRVGP